MEAEENSTTSSVISGFTLQGILLGSVVQHRYVTLYSRI